MILPVLLSSSGRAQYHSSHLPASAPPCESSEARPRRRQGAPSAQYPICDATVSLVVQFSVKPVASRLVKSASASRGGVFILMNTLLVLSMASTAVVATLLADVRAELPPCGPSLAPMP